MEPTALKPSRLTPEPKVWASPTTQSNLQALSHGPHCFGFLLTAMLTCHPGFIRLNFKWLLVWLESSWHVFYHLFCQQTALLPVPQLMFSGVPHRGSYLNTQGLMPLIPAVVSTQLQSTLPPRLVWLAWRGDLPFPSLPAAGHGPGAALKLYPRFKNDDGDA